jgi:AAA+ superfamily predicted ATPase
MNEDLKFHIRSMSRFVYVVTEEEDRFLVRLKQMLAKLEKRIHVYNSAFGMVPLAHLLEDWRSGAHKEQPNMGIHEALISMYKDNPGEEVNFYVITDPDRWLQDPQVVRRFLNLAHQLHQNDKMIKVTFFVGPRLVVPQKLSRYIEVVYDKGPDSEEIKTILAETIGKIPSQPQPSETVVRALQGLTSYEIDAVMCQSLIAAKKDKTSAARFDTRHIQEYKRRQLKKTDLINYIDTSGDGFDKVGGVARFKSWVEKNKASWTREGQKFGLKPPRGILLVGVWGCGKSISVKALGNAWNLPVVQLELGKLRQSGVGDSEANMYRVLSLVESISPCILWVDEAEKSLSGGQSSGQSDAGTTSRMIGIMSTWIQETKSEICVALTVNSLKTLPVEFVRRMNERFFFDLPSEDERIDILKIHLLKQGQDPKTFKSLAKLAEDAKLMVGSEIEHAIETSMTESFHANKPALDEEILSKELRRKPRIFRTLADELKEVLDWVGYDPETGDGIRARFASETKGEGFRAHQTNG